MNGTTWNAFGNGVANFNLEDMTVSGLSTGIAWLDAIKNNATVLRCFVYVENILTSFPSGVQDYLYGDGTMLGMIYRSEHEENPGIDPYVLRTEWYLCAVKLSKQ